MTKSFAGSPQFAAAETLTDEDRKQLQTAVDTLANQKSKWSQTTCQQRIALIDDLVAALKTVAQAWVESGCAAKGHRLGTPPAGEEWLTGPCLVARNLRLLKQSISQIQKHGKPKLPAQPYSRQDGQVVVRAFPTGIFDKLLFRGFTSEIWMEPDVTQSQFESTMAVNYCDSTSKTGVLCLVLGAGNVSSIGPMDVLYKLFVENQVVLLKMNPVNEYLTPYFEKAFQPLIAAGYLRVVKGGAEAGKFLCQHNDVDEIHITGSDKTYDAIVFGSGSEGEQNKQNNNRVCEKPVTSELGNVSPVVVVPGKWSQSDIDFQAENVATMLVNNAGFNCNALRVLITHKDWDQREQFLGAITKAFERTANRTAYYPGAKQRFEKFAGNYADVETIGAGDGEALPWTVIHNLNPDDEDQMCFNTEAFCSVAGETSLPGETAADYLRNAVTFCNDTVWGTLNATIIVHPKTEKHPEMKPVIDRAIADLRYGTVAINHWAGVNFGLTSTTWGAFPGHTPQDIQSGTGVVHNTYMFDRPQKSVMRGPFNAFPKPVWFCTHRNTHKLGPALFRFECSPSWFKLPAVAIHAIG